MPRIVALVLAGLVSSVAFAAPSLEPPKAKEKWITLRADEFRFVSNASPAKTLDIARDLLRMRAAIGAVTNLKVRSALPTTVFIFANERVFSGYRDAVLQQKAENIVGVFTGSQTDNFILLRADVQEIDRTVYHELTHYFVRNTSGPLPVWISEGIAEYYSTFATSGTDVHIGRPIAEHVHWLRGTTLIPLRELFATTSASRIYNEGSRSGVLYAQSWALFHYLMSDAGRRAQFSRFLTLLGASKPVDEAFQTAFAIPYTDLEHELRKYVRRPAFGYVKHSVADLPIVEPPQPEPMAHGDVLFALGHLLGHTDKNNAVLAERYLRESLAANPRNASAHADLGRLHEQAGRAAEADAAYRTAVELGSSDAGVYIFAGLSLVQRFAGKLTSEIPAAELRYARSLFQRATELDPTMALAWAGLGTTYMGETNVTPGIAALEKSLKLAPGDEQAAFHLMQLYAMSGRQEEAAQMFDKTLVHSPNAQMVAHARETLQLAEVRKVESLAAAGKSAEAAARAKLLMKHTKDESLKEYLAGFLENLEAMAAAEVVNRAISHANAGNHLEALRILDEVMPTITDADLLAQTQKFRAEVAQRVMSKKKK